MSANYEIVVYDFFDYEDGYAIFKNFEYIGKDDQVDMVELLAWANGKVVEFNKHYLLPEWDQGCWGNYDGMIAWCDEVRSVH